MWHIIDTKEGLLELRKALSGRALAFDFETTGTDWMTDSIVGLAIASADDAWYVTLENKLTPTSLGEVLGGWFDDPQQTLFAHNAKFDMHFLCKIGVILPQSPIDTMGLAQIYNESAPLGLKDLTFLILDRNARPWDKTFLTWSLVEKAAYACADARNTYDLAVWYMERIVGDLADYFNTYMLPLPMVALKMELDGWMLDKPRVERYGKQIQTRIDDLSLTICASAPGLENPNSTQQLAEALTKLGAKWARDEYTRTKRKSTNQATLEAMLARNPNSQVRKVIEMVSELRKQVKLQGYITGNRGLLNHLDEHGRIHPTWRVFGTFTGRWSCADPNLQNIPKFREGDVFDENPRDWFCAGPGNVLVIGDLGQAELKILAALSQDELLTSAFRHGQDIHQLTASLVLGIPLDDVDGAHRFIGKTLNFATVYGGGADRLAQIAGVPPEDGERFIRKFYQTYRGVAKWRAEIVSQARLDGVVYTAFGRPRRPLLFRLEELIGQPPTEELEPGDARLDLAGLEQELKKKGLKRDDLTHLNKQYLGSRAERQAVNAVIQGSVGDIINRALIELAEYDVLIVGQIHDEIVIEVPEGLAEQGAQLLKNALHTEVGGIVLDADAKIQKTWGGES